MLGVLADITKWLSTHNIVVLLEPAVAAKELANAAELGISGLFSTWKSDEDLSFLSEKVDFVVCIGGDGGVSIVEDILFQ